MARYAIVNVSIKDLSKIIRDFERLPNKCYERRRPKHDTTDGYFYLARQIPKCIMRSDVLNLHVYPVITEMTGARHIPISHICSIYNRKSKYFLTDENLSRVCSTDKGESKSVISNASSTENSE